MSTVTDFARRPSAGEHDPFYGTYLARVPDGDLRATLERQHAQHLDQLSVLREADGDVRYAPGKWSVKEVLGHVVDSERVFSFRALHFARGAAEELPGFDENAWGVRAGYARRRLTSIIDELTTVRTATLFLLRGLDEEALQRQGIANDRPISVRALFWIMAGHERHHMHVLRDRYM